MNNGTYQRHGGLDPGELRALGLDPRSVLDFSASVNPLGPPPGLWRALRTIDLAAYPDRACLELTEALAGRTGVAPERVLCGNGSTELLHLLARAFVRSGDGVAILAPAFGEYEAAARLAGGGVSLVWARAEDGFRWDLSEALRAIERAQPALVFVAVPNNPTGVALTEDDLARLADAFPQRSGLLVVDEAYRAFARRPTGPRPLLDRENVVLVRSMTKDYGLAGLRVGYLLAAAPVVEQVRAMQPAWSVSALAQAGGLFALRCEGHVARARQTVERSKAYLVRELRRLSLDPLDSEANFLLVEVGDAAALRLRLLRAGVAVRDCASFGLPRHIRIGVRRIGECRRLVAALSEARAHG